MIDRVTALDVLGRCKGRLADSYGITTLGIFGSVARGEASDGSDVDVVVEMVKPNLFTLVHVKEELEEALHQQVDIVHYRSKMNAFLKQRIDREVIYV